MLYIAYIEYCAGTQLFTPDQTYEELLRCYFSDWTFQCTTFTGEYTYEKFTEQLKTKFVAILSINQDKSLTFYSGNKVQPKAGDKLIFYTKKLKEKKAS